MEALCSGHACHLPPHFLSASQLHRIRPKLVGKCSLKHAQQQRRWTRYAVHRGIARPESQVAAGSDAALSAAILVTTLLIHPTVSGRRVSHSKLLPGGDSCVMCRASAASTVAVTVEPAGNNARRLYAGVDISAPVDVVWGALTDYDGLGTFIPGTAFARSRPKSKTAAAVDKLTQGQHEGQRRSISCLCHVE